MFCNLFVWILHLLIVTSTDRIDIFPVPTQSYLQIFLIYWHSYCIEHKTIVIHQSKYYIADMHRLNICPAASQSKYYNPHFYGHCKKKPQNDCVHNSFFYLDWWLCLKLLTIQITDWLTNQINTKKMPKNELKIQNIKKYTLESLCDTFR